MSELGEFRLLLTGSRRWLDQLAIWRQLNWWLGEYDVDLLVIHGNCLLVPTRSPSNGASTTKLILRAIQQSGSGSVSQPGRSVTKS